MGAVLACLGKAEPPEPEARPLFVTHPPIASKSRDCEDWVTIFRL